MRLSAVMLAGLTLTACATAERIQGPSGRPAYAMDCGTSVTTCYKRAGELCPAGYTVIDRASGTAGVPVSGGFLMAPQHSLAVECK